MKSKLRTSLAVTVLAAAFLVSGIDRAGAQSVSSTPCSQRYKLAWTMPLRSSDVGRSLSSVFGRSEFSTVIKPRGNLKRMQIGRAPDGTVALQMNIPKGENKTTEFFLSPFGSKGVDAACLSLRVFMESGFQWPLNGGGTKMGWGLWGGDQASMVSGGTPPEKQLGWSVRNVNSVWGFRHYSYHLNRSSQWGDQGSPLARWESSAWRSGRWHTIELEVGMNTPGKSNGYLQLWLDGNNRKTKTGLVFRRNSNWAVRGLMFSDIWGGNTKDSKNWSPKSQKMWYADYKLYSSSGNASGQSGSTTSSNAGGSQSGNSSQASGSSGSFGALSPSGTVGRGSVTLQWRPDPRANRYYVRVLTKREKWNDRRDVFGGSAYTNKHCSGSTCSLSIGGLPADQYEWMVRPQKDTSVLGSYDTLAFTVSNSASGSSSSSGSTTSGNTGGSQSGSSNQASGSSGSFGALSPSGTVGRSSVTLRWRPDPRANRYYVRVLTKREKWNDRRDVFGGSAYTNKHCSGSTCSLSIGGLPADQYEWMVRPQKDTSVLSSYDTLAFTAR